jgi:hypothetical protein
LRITETLHDSPTEHCYAGHEDEIKPYLGQGVIVEE